MSIDVNALQELPEIEQERVGLIPTCKTTQQCRGGTCRLTDLPFLGKE